LVKGALQSAGKSLYLGVLEVLWPSDCPGCGRPPDYPETALCSECMRLLTAALEENRCPRCGASRSHVLDSRDRCQNCSRDPLRFNRTIAGGDWIPPMSQLIVKFKFNRRRHLAKVISSFISEAAARNPIMAEFIVPVPLHWTTRLKRGFNQAELLASHIGTRHKLPVIGALKRKRRTPSQRNYTRTGRFENVKGAFAPTRVAARLKGRSVALVDDVMTTGATLSECARTLKRSGAGSVTALVAARSILSIRQIYRT